MQQHQKRLLLSGLVVALGVGASYALRSPQEGGLPELPAEPRATRVTLVESHPFELAEPRVHRYRAEAPTYTQGHVLVLATDPELLVPRQGYEPVLYVGAETAERVNTGADSGHLVAIVPELGGGPIGRQPIFFGTPALPEEVTLETARAELEAARAEGVAAAGAPRAAAGERLVLPDGYELLYFASSLVEQYSPTEADLVRGLRAPRLGR